MDHLHYYWIIASYKDLLTNEIHYVYIKPDKEERLNRKLKTRLNTQRILLLEKEQEFIIQKNEHFINLIEELNHSEYQKRYCFQFNINNNVECVEVFPAYLHSQDDIKTISEFIDTAQKNTQFLIAVIKRDHYNYNYVFKDYNGREETRPETLYLEHLRKEHNLYPLTNFVKITLLPHLSYIRL